MAMFYKHHYNRRFLITLNFRYLTSFDPHEINSDKIYGIVFVYSFEKKIKHCEHTEENKINSP